MWTNTRYALLAVLAAAPSAFATECGTLDGCFLRDISTGTDVKLTGNDSYDIRPGAGPNDYSIQCKTDYKTGEMDFMKFFYDGKVQDEFGEPRWMNGDSDNGSFVNTAEYLSTCGTKTIKVEGHVWSNQCFVQTFVLEAKCEGEPEPPVPAPVAPPTAKPVVPETAKPTKAPTGAPVVPPTDKPVVPPTDKPVVPPTDKPVVPPTDKPVVPPTDKPVVPPTDKPVVPPTEKPVVPPTDKPVVPPTDKPVVPPTGKPVPAPTGKPVVPPTGKPVPAPTKKPTAKPTTPVVNPYTKPTAPVKPPTCPNFVCPANSVRVAGRTCYRSFDDCQCNAGFKKDGMQCVVDCPNYVCPANSVRIAGKTCYRAFDDCACTAGFKKENGACVADCRNFVCPVNSVRIQGRSCYDSFNDCQCNSGFKKENGACVVDCPNFVCPDNSVRVPDKTCYRSFDDCQCNHAYRKEGNQCVYCKTFTCPTNSVRTPGLKCYLGFDDCTCNAGYSKVDGQCINSKCNYQCPVNSIRIPGQGCYDDFADCECLHGYKKLNGACAIDDRCNYVCPSNSARIPNQVCYDDFDDCRCNTGFRKLNGECVKDTYLDPKCDFQCPAFSSRILGQSCYDSFADCKCDSGFRKENNQCVNDNGCPCKMGYKLVDGKCTPSWCSSNYRCPNNSKPIEGRECLWTIWDCSCSPGFVVAGDACVEQGRCGAGMKLLDGRCVESWCVKAKCIANSTPIKESGCINSAWDCKCAAGFTMIGEACVANGPCGAGKKLLDGRCVEDWCTKAKCPANSKPIRDSGCINSVWGDCKCLDGFNMVGDACVAVVPNPCKPGYKVLNGVCRPDWCFSSFSCPANSKPIEGRECLYSIWDCQCDAGRKIVGNACVEEASPCPAGRKLVSGSCVVLSCAADFHCPVNSKRIPNLECYDTIDDCVCNDGFRKEWGTCVVGTGGCKYGVDWAGRCKPCPTK